MEEINKHFSLGAFIASEESVFPVFQFLHFSLVNNLFIRTEKLITAERICEFLFPTHQCLNQLRHQD